MTLGEKIKDVRNFRRMTQKQLGLSAGFNESGADARIREYERNIKIPRGKTLEKLADALEVSHATLTGGELGTIEHLMHSLFWLEYKFEGIMKVLPFKTQITYPEMENIEGFGTHPELGKVDPSAVGIFFEVPEINDCLKEWYMRKTYHDEGLITYHDYFDWKLRWSHDENSYKKFMSNMLNDRN